MIQLGDGIVIGHKDIEGDVMDILSYVNSLISYGIDKKLIEYEDQNYCFNRYVKLLDILDINKDFFYTENRDDIELTTLIEPILSWAIEHELIEDTVGQRDLFDTELMNILIPRPSVIIDKFKTLYENNPMMATQYYYNLSMDSNYIRRDRINKNIGWQTETDYGDLEITINLSKPEKDPRDIVRAASNQTKKYPKCLLCKENEGFLGGKGHPARGSHRVIPMDIEGDKWFLQYSPYVYYNEHSIVFSDNHSRMFLDKNTFDTIMNINDYLPHYFLGANADLPIVGGSILSHMHFQGGNKTMPLQKAGYKWSTCVNEIQVGIVDWPMSVVRLCGKDKDELSNMAGIFLKQWQHYNNYSLGIVSHSDDTPHNTITTIGKKVGNAYRLDLILRNNRQSTEHPFGIFHPHVELHNIKKENIGLIEAMGLAILPGRLKKELDGIAEVLDENKDQIPEELLIHKDWINDIRKRFIDYTDSTDRFLKNEVSAVFLKVLKDCGVFKDDDEGILAFKSFISNVERVLVCE